MTPTSCPKRGQRIECRPFAAHAMLPASAKATVRSSQLFPMPAKFSRWACCRIWALSTGLCPSTVGRIRYGVPRTLRKPNTSSFRVGDQVGCTMDKEVRHHKKITLALAIAEGESIIAWAQENGVPERTAFYWAQDPKVRREVEACRCRVVNSIQSGNAA